MKAPWARWPEGANGSEGGIDARSLFISIQPRFANAILDGSKTIELRRTKPTLRPEALALIYASSPKKALVGWATVEEVVRATPGGLWQVHREDAGVSSAEFDNYFEGSSVAIGLRLANVGRAEREIGLVDLRAQGLHPPQSWRYLPTLVANGLRERMSSERGSGPSSLCADLAVGFG